MKHLVTKALVLIVLPFLLSCVTPHQLILEQPLEGRCTLVGAVLIENNGIEEMYQAVTKNITVLISCRPAVNGNEPAGYRVKTDEHGYYAVSNVPRGSYVVKGFEVDLGFDTRLFVNSRWDGYTQIFYSSGETIDYTVREWPENQDGPVINMNIDYFMIDQAERIVHANYKALKETQLTLKNRTYTMSNPRPYFIQKFPEKTWLQTEGN